jgi:hypothetical protein
MEKYGFVYIWFDSWRKMYYIGCHWGREDDGYICSSTRMRKAYRRRPQDFKRRIIQKGIARDVLMDEEFKWLNLVPDEQLGNKYYNLSKRHFGHWSSNEEKLKSVGEKISDSVKQLHQDPEYREKYLEGLKKRPPQTKEQIQKRSDALRGKPRSEETKKKISDTNTGKVNGPLSEETKKKLSIALSGEKNPFYGKKHDPEKKKQMSRKASATLKGRHPSHATDAITGSFWWNNGQINKRTRVAPGPDWVRGKLKRKT